MYALTKSSFYIVISSMVVSLAGSSRTVHLVKGMNASIPYSSMYPIVALSSFASANRSSPVNSMFSNVQWLVILKFV